MVRLSKNYMDSVRFKAHSYLVSDFGTSCALDNNFVIAGFYYNLIVHAFKYNRCHHTGNSSFFFGCHYYILRSYDNVDFGTDCHIVKAVKISSAEANLAFARHTTVKNIAFAYKVGNKYRIRLIIYLFRSSYLLNHTVGHYDNLIGHRKCFFLVMRYIYKSNSEFLMHCFEFKLHLLTHL